MKTMTLPNNRNNNSIEEQQQLYNYFLDLVQVQSSSEVIDRFRILFIQGGGYPDREVVKVLEKIMASKEIEEEFNYILNRCCHILINRWQPYRTKNEAIVELIRLFEEIENRDVKKSYASKGGRRLLELVKSFTSSEQYLTLKRLAEVMDESPYSHRDTETALATPLRILIPRYPYLYKHCLVSEDSSYEHQQTVKKIQQEKQQEFEINLSQYVTHKVREIRKARQGFSTLIRESSQNLSNPTLLSDRELFLGLKQYVGKVEGSENYRDLAKRFLAHTKQPQSYRAFKDSFYEYLSTSFNIDSSQSVRKLNDKLYKQLQTTLVHSNDKQFSESLMMRTCSQMLNFLVVDSAQRPQHYLFLDMLGNLGPISTVGLLLQIVLVCHRIRSYLEKRFAILFNHYETYNRDAVQWLVKALENMNLALTTNFGKVDLSFIR